MTFKPNRFNNVTIIVLLTDQMVDQILLNNPSKRPKSPSKIDQIIKYDRNDFREL